MLLGNYSFEQLESCRQSHRRARLIYGYLVRNQHDGLRQLSDSTHLAYDFVVDTSSRCQKICSKSNGAKMHIGLLFSAIIGENSGSLLIGDEFCCTPPKSRLEKVLVAKFRDSEAM